MRGCVAAYGVTCERDSHGPNGNRENREAISLLRVMVRFDVKAKQPCGQRAMREKERPEVTVLIVNPRRARK